MCMEWLIPAGVCFLYSVFFIVTNMWSVLFGVLSVCFLDARGVKAQNTSSVMKCYQCSGYDYLPANVLSQIDDLNITDSDFASKVGACTKDNYCHNGAFCAKRTVTYKLSILGVSYKYKTWNKLCTSTRLDGAGGTPSNGQCYNDTSSAGTDGDAATGVSKTSTWCYCNNKDYCNGAPSSGLSGGLLVTVAFLLSALYIK